uniref:Uncharacterized protein n=1 Tax=viral metagenome TaxID=1070528 RepID=A0A6C0JBB3_9ZZZZ
MGNSCDSKLPKQYINDPLDKVGTIKHMNDVCAPSGQGSKYFLKYIPQNGEYEWHEDNEPADEDKCFYCWDNKGKTSTCTKGCSTGTIGKYKRKYYTADQNKCCSLTDSITLGDHTCDPIYRGPLAEGCKNAMIAKCVEGNNTDIFHKEECKLFCAADKDNICHNKKRTICNDPNNEMSLDCLQWCQDNPGECDKSMIKFCSLTENLHNPLCACINTFLDVFMDNGESSIKTKYNPLCVDDKCIKSGYATQSMKTSRGQGCEIVNCSVYNIIKDAHKGDINHNSVVQSCGGKSTKPHKIESKVRRFAENFEIPKLKNAGGAIEKILIIFVLLVVFLSVYIYWT